MVDEERQEAFAAALTPAHIAKAQEVLFGGGLAVFKGMAIAARHNATKGGRKPSGRDVWNAMLRLNEPPRRGRTRGEDPTPEEEAIAAAAWDIWKLRKVIALRFWPDEAIGEFQLKADELAKIAADRRGCDPKKALRHYSEERLASRG